MLVLNELDIELRERDRKGRTEGGREGAKDGGETGGAHVRVSKIHEEGNA